MSKKNKDHREVATSPEETERLLNLADILFYRVAELPPQRFDMGHFITAIPGDSSDKMAVSKMRASSFKCDCAACAAGWGAVFHRELGFDLPLYQDSQTIDWSEIEEIFTEDGSLQSWIFQGNWGGVVDDTAKGAARRIWYALRNGIPNNYRISSYVVGLYKNTRRPKRSMEFVESIPHMAQKKGRTT